MAITAGTLWGTFGRNRRNLLAKPRQDTRLDDAFAPFVPIVPRQAVAAGLTI
jgi:hypothetical protein